MTPYADEGLIGPVLGPADRTGWKPRAW